MKIQHCYKNGVIGWKAGTVGVCQIGINAKFKAEKQARLLDEKSARLAGEDKNEEVIEKATEEEKETTERVCSECGCKISTRNKTGICNKCRKKEK